MKKTPYCDRHQELVWSTRILFGLMIGNEAVTLATGRSIVGCIAMLIGGI